MAFIDARAVETGTVEQADICIIGGGAAGIALCRAFADTPLKVILLESGDFFPDAETQLLYDGQSAGFTYSPLETRARYFGGCTNRWYGYCVPIDPFMFSQRDWLPVSGWPITYDELAPYYKPAADFLDVSADLTGAYHPHTALTPERDGFQISQWQCIPHRKLRLAKVHGAALGKSSNIKVFLNANVTQIVVNENGSHATEVEVATLTNRRFHVKARHFILACGALENARVLLASNDRMQNGVGNTRDTVGRYFTDHMYAASIGRMITRASDGLFAETLAERRKMRVHDYAERALLFAPSQALMRQRNLFASIMLISIERHETTIEDPLENFLSNAILEGEGATKVFFISGHFEQTPNPGSRIILSDDKDRLGMPKLKTLWTHTPADYDNMQRTTFLFADMMQHQGYGMLKLDDWIINGDFSPAHFRQSHHPMGTTRMSADPALGVVDADCRVHGMDNLFIAGSSVFPVEGWENPTITIVALCYRMARHIKSLQA